MIERSASSPRATASRSRPSCAAPDDRAARGDGAVPPAPAVRRHDALDRDRRAVRRAPARRRHVPALQLPRRRGQRRAPTTTGAASSSTCAPRSTTLAARLEPTAMPLLLAGWSFGADMTLATVDDRARRRGSRSHRRCGSSRRLLGGRRTTRARSCSCSPSTTSSASRRRWSTQIGRLDRDRDRGGRGREPLLRRPHRPRSSSSRRGVRGPGGQRES